MSFLDTVSRPATRGAQHEGALNKLFTEFTHSLNILQKKTGALGSKRDSMDLRCSIETELIPQCETLRDEVQQVITSNYSSGKIVSDFAGLKEELLKSKRKYSELKSKFPLRKNQRANSTSQNSGYVSMPLASSDEATPLLQERAQLQAQRQEQTQSTVSQDELNFHTLVQQERSEEISRIHSAVQEVNAIFHQLGTLVREQGDDVDNIDNNISGLAGNLQRANEQLGKADQSQRKKNRCGIVTLVIIVVIVLCIVLAALS